MALDELSLTLSSLRSAYAGGLDPKDLVREIYKRIDALSDPGIFISLASLDDSLGNAAQLADLDPSSALWGIPCAIKDNIDVRGLSTTAACPDFAYLARNDAFTVEKLRAAGAIVIGKTNLDQFATGLVGVRTPFPIPKNAVDPRLVPGGSSSGSAVAVGQKLVSFALGTDTAGSGRVPAALNNIVGLKPSLGLLSSSGVVPACRSLDTVSIFALNVEDANRVLEVATGYDPSDPFSRPVSSPPVSSGPSTARADRLRIGVPDPESRRFFSDPIHAQCFERDLKRFAKLGVELIQLPFESFYAIADLLYDGPWVAERYVVLRDLLSKQPQSIHPVTREIVAAATKYSAADTFSAFYEFKRLARIARDHLATVDCLCVPSVPTVFTRDDLERDPVGPNSVLGTYTNFVNLLGLCAIAIPTAARPDGWPMGVTLLADTDCDNYIASVASRLQSSANAEMMNADLKTNTLSHNRTRSARPDPNAAVSAEVQVPEAMELEEISIAVCGAHMSGLALNHELTSLGGRFLYQTTTRPEYRLYALAGGPPARPGMVHVGEAAGNAIELEVWALPKKQFADFVLGIPRPLGIGTVLLCEDRAVPGFVCESSGIEGATDISSFGGWRAFQAGCA